jgi:hypothetical protein
MATPTLVDGYEPLKDSVFRLLWRKEEAVSQLIVGETLQMYHGIGELLDRYLLAQQDRGGTGSRRWRGRRRTVG